MIKNARAINFLLIMLLIFIFSECIKKKNKKNIPEDINCDNAQACVGNLTGDTIFYGWNSNTLYDTLLPGKTTCISVGPVRVIYNRKNGEIIEKSYQTITINSNWGIWAMNIENCQKRSNFEYDFQNPSDSLIFLYSE